MTDIYEWLFDQYALPKLQDIEEDYNDTLFAFAERAGLPQKTRLRLHDMVLNMRTEWGAEAFALGVRFGLRLSRPRARSEKPGWLMNFLP